MKSQNCDIQKKRILQTGCYKSEGLNMKNKLKTALMLQNYDVWDTGVTGYFIKRFWKSCLKWGETQYGIEFDRRYLSEDDIISGRLEQDGFDVLIGPGGSGTWYRAKERFHANL